MGSGTAFFLGDKDKRRFFLITNKHVIARNDEIRQKNNELKLLLNTINQNNKIGKNELTILYDKNIVREHPDPDVDVYILDITNVIDQSVKIEDEQLYSVSILSNYLATPEKLKEYDIKITDEVFIIGYPSLNKLQHHLNNFPFVRQSTLASKIGEPLEDEYKDKKIDIIRKRILRGFLIDGGVIPGMSGSPVILKPNHYRQIRKEIIYDYFPPLLLGIISETRFIFTDNFYDVDIIQWQIWVLHLIL